MSQTFPALLLAATVLSVIAFSPTRAQTPAPSDLATPELTELRVQQLALQENGKKIDEKLAAVAEEIRQARIYVSRGGRTK